MFLEYIQEHQERIITLIGQHFMLFGISMVFTLLVGIGISIYVSREGAGRIGKIVLNVTAAAQAVPSIAVVALVFLFIGIGATPAIVALVIYSLVPIVFNATSGLLSIDSKVIEAARGSGYTQKQILWRIKFPIATPVIMAGIRSAATINIGTATVAAVIGGGGLGDLIFTGIKLNKDHVILIGAVLTSLIAILIDTLFYYLERRVTPKGLQVKR